MTWAVKLKNYSLSDIKDNLENNNDHYEFIVKQKQKIFDIKSNADIIPYIITKTKQYAEHKFLLNAGKKVKYTPDDIIKILSKLDFIRLRIVKSKLNKIIEKSFWIKDYDNTKWLYQPADIDMLCELIYDELNMSNFNSVLANLKGRLNSISPDKGLFKLLNEPPIHITLTNNGIFNSKTYTLTTENEHHYEFINKLNYRILDPSQVNQGHYEINKRIFNDWCDKDLDKVLYLKQVALATLDGNGRNKYHIIVADGGNGKSTYLYMLEKLATGYFVSLNMNEIIDDNKLVPVNGSTKLLVGHELSTKAKISGEAISRLKMIVTGDEFAINVKYEQARNVFTKGVKIQATNTLPKVFENTPAITDRLNIFEWTNVNYRKLNQNLKLDLLLDDPNFIEALIAWIFTDTETFDKFIEIESIKKASKDLVMDSDQVYQYLTWLKEQEILIGTLLTSINYQQYLYWNKTENGNIKPLKKHELTKRMKKLAPEFGLIYIDDNTRLSAISKLDYNVELLNEQFFNGELKYNKYETSRYFLCEDQISTKEIETFKLKLENNELDDIQSFKDHLILEYLISKKFDPAIIFNQLLKDKYDEI